MRGKLAKKLRRIVYGNDLSHRQRDFQKQKRNIETGAIEATGNRHIREIEINLISSYFDMLDWCYKYFTIEDIEKITIYK